MNCHHPLRRAFWLGEFDPRPLALFRILLGGVLLQDLLDYARELRVFASDEGMLPRSVARAWSTWSVFDLVGSPGAVALVYGAGVLAVVAFTLGLWTRAATVVAWVFVVSLHHRNPFVTDAGDTLVGALLFWSMFADLGACWSLDARRRGTRTRVPVFPLRILQLQMAVLYFTTARLKYRLGWMRGEAIFQTLQLEGFIRPLGTMLGRSPLLCRISTYAILGMEALFPFAAFSPVLIRASRLLALLLGVAIQVGIAATMRVGVFQGAMLSTCALFVLPEWFDAAEAWLRKRVGDTTRPVSPPAATATTGSGRATAGSRAQHVLWAAISAQFVLAIWPFFAERRFPPPRLLRDERDLLSIEQPADLFGTIYDVPHWSAPGRHVDGTDTEVLDAALPGARPRGPGWRFSRWNKFRFKEREAPLPWTTLGPVLCRAYDAATGATERTRLARFDVHDDVVHPVRPGESPGPPTRRHLWHQECP